MKKIFIFLIGICFFINCSVLAQTQTEEDEVRSFIDRLLFCFSIKHSNVEEYERRFGSNGIMASLSTPSVYENFLTFYQNRWKYRINEGLTVSSGLVGIGPVKKDKELLTASVRLYVATKTAHVEPPKQFTWDLVVQCDTSKNKETDRCLVTQIQAMTETFSQTVISNYENPNLPICGSVDPIEPCLLYVLNSSSGIDRKAKDFFIQILDEWDLSMDELLSANSVYQNQIIPPGYFAEIVIPQKGAKKVKEADAPKKVVPNMNKRRPMGICGSVSETQECLFYALNNSDNDKLVEDFFKEVSRATKRSIFLIHADNPVYEKRIISPGYFAEIIVTAMK